MFLIHIDGGQSQFQLATAGFGNMIMTNWVF